MLYYIFQDEGHYTPKRRILTIGDDEPDKEHSEQLEEHVMLVGQSADSKEARNKWIDAVERILEDESFKRGEEHMNHGFNEVRYDGDYGLHEEHRDIRSETR